MVLAQKFFPHLCQIMWVAVVVPAINRKNLSGFPIKMNYLPLVFREPLPTVSRSPLSNIRSWKNEFKGLWGSGFRQDIGIVLYWQAHTCISFSYLSIWSGSSGRMVMRVPIVTEIKNKAVFSNLVTCL